MDEEDGAGFFSMERSSLYLICTVILLLVLLIAVIAYICYVLKSIRDVRLREHNKVTPTHSFDVDILERVSTIDKT